MTHTYTLTTTNLNRQIVRQSNHRSVANLYRAWTREQNRIHPEGRGAQKAWSGYVDIKDETGARYEFDAPTGTGEVPTLWNHETLGKV